MGMNNPLEVPGPYALEMSGNKEHGGYGKMQNMRGWYGQKQSTRLYSVFLRGALRKASARRILNELQCLDYAALYTLTLAADVD
mmetsp:Transcript_26917/g.62992  ORF Transcript_26917/g.62992 Transcript_26917/m.62992 type:complete len:84 (+) Transcript_26917:86-337(+)